jgi:small subunit ribosomal protein S6
MFIIHTGDDDETSRNNVLDQIQAEIKKQKGQVVLIHPMGKKEFIYPINRIRSGYYYLIYFEVNPLGIQKMQDRYKINQNILRELILRTDKVPDSLSAPSEPSAIVSEPQPVDTPSKAVSQPENAETADKVTEQAATQEVVSETEVGEDAPEVKTSSDGQPVDVSEPVEPKN